MCSDYKDRELFIPDFEVFRDDGLNKADNSSGRGVLLAVHNRFDPTFVKSSHTASFEYICVKITVLKRFLYIFCCYIRPSQPIIGYQHAVDAFDSILDVVDPSDTVVTVGDFNLPNLKWVKSNDDSYYFASNPSSDKEVLFTDCLSDSGLFQISGITNNLDRQLDLVFTSDADNCIVVESHHLLSHLDCYHPPLSITYSYDKVNKVPSSEYSYRFNFRKTNFEKLKNLLNNTDFQNIFVCKHIQIDDAISQFYEKIFNCFQLSVPFVPQKSISSSPPWYNKELRELRNKRNKSWRVYLNSRSDSDYHNYQTTFTNFSKLCESLYASYLNQMQSNLISDPKKFFQFINVKRKSDNYPPTLKLDDASSENPKEIANLFAHFFSQSFTSHVIEPDPDYFSYMKNCSQTSLTTIEIPLEIVEEKINTLRNDYSPGPDGLPAIVLKECQNFLAKPIMALFQLSISQGIFPSLWKSSYITPLHKKGKKNEISNYRPIAKLSCIPKLFESIVYDTMYFHCKSIFSPKQHGFLKGRSTTTNLTEFVSNTLCALEDGNEVDVIATDFSKAFDKISHSIIFFKLNALGFQSSFIKWIESYLKNRHYNVIFRSSISEPFVATSGVPQGSHLGPLIFVLITNDVECIIKNSQLSIYADDMKIYRQILVPLDYNLLQDDLDNFSKWCEKNFLMLNVSKCQFITYSRKRISSPPRIYYISDNPVPVVTSLRDLGVICDKELNFRSHIDNIINRANSALGFVKHWSKEFSNPYVTKSLYFTFVRPILEYASQVWSPYYNTHSLRIEAVQRRFIRFALRGLPWSDPNNLPPYMDRLRLINVQSLEIRRKIADTLFVHQLLSGNIDCPALLQTISFNTNPRNLRSVPVFRLKAHRTDYGSNEPMCRMLRIVNDIPNIFDFHLSKLGLKNAIFLNPYPTSS